MSGKGEGKYLLKDVKVYIHEKGKSNARITHIDIESSEIAEIIGKEPTYCAGKEGGCFIGLKKDMLERASMLIKKKKAKIEKK